ncbi:hypothetical protein V490_00384, partial [Pseudogymnoascus sp. VKM F-3557]
MHFQLYTLLLIALASASLTTPLANNKRYDAATHPSSLTLQQKLDLAPTEVDRLALLPRAENHVFDFLHSTIGITTGNGGETIKADRSTFPALIGSSGSMTVGFIGACGFNTPHTHPRSAELNIIVQGTLKGSVTAENGSPHLQHTLKQYQMTVFPQGAMHTEWNPNCEPAVFVASFSNEDPGVQQTLQSLMGFEDEVVRAAVGGDGLVDGKDLEKFRAYIPANVALGVESCLQKCKLGMTVTRSNPSLPSHTFHTFAPSKLRRLRSYFIILLLFASKPLVHPTPHEGLAKKLSEWSSGERGERKEVWEESAENGTELRGNTFESSATMAPWKMGVGLRGGAVFWNGYVASAQLGDKVEDNSEDNDGGQKLQRLTQTGAKLNIKLGYQRLLQAGRQTFKGGRAQQVWGIPQLLAAVQAQGVEESGEEEYWIRKKTLDELDSFMAELSQAWAGQDLGGGVSSGSDDDADADADRMRPAATVARGNIMAAFAKGGSSSNWYEDDLRRRSGRSASMNSTFIHMQRHIGNSTSFAFQSKSHLYEEDRTPLLLAARDGHEAIVKSLLNSDIVNIDSKDSHGRTPLSWAAEDGHEGVVKLRLDKGAKLETEDSRGRTPLS